MINRIPTPQHSIESRITVQPYDETTDNDPQNPGAKFIEWIGKNSEKLFNRFVVYSLSNLQKLQQRDGKIDLANFLYSLRPEKRTLSTPFPRNQFAAEMTKLSTELGNGSYMPTMADTYLKGTMELYPDKKFMNVRKIYVNPPVEKAADFVRSFYKQLYRQKVPIYEAKVHADEFEEDDAGTQIVKQGHNTLVVYLATDKAMPYLLRAIADAEKDSGVQLMSFERGDVQKSPTLLSGKVILGGMDTDSRSFDQWTDAVANAARLAFEKNPKLTEVEAQAAMTAELKKRLGREPKDYLSPRV